MITVRPSQSIGIIGPAIPVIVGPAENQPDERSAATVIAPAALLTVEPEPRAAWDERGWVESAGNGTGTYEGFYQTRRRAGDIARFAGRIVVKNGIVTPYIADPPISIKRHPKGPCFQLTQPPWFRVHWRKPATTVDDALLYVEKVLSEVLH
jgi:hypothetical protein